MIETKAISFKVGGRGIFLSSRAWPVLFLLLVLGLKQAEASTAFVMRGGGAIFLAKNLDWPLGEGYVFINKKNVTKEAFGSHPATLLRWTSKYGSVTFNQFGREFPLGGMNEAGLVIEELNGQSEYPPPDSRPALNEFQWIQYHLDSHGTVKDVLESESKLRISKFLSHLHYLVADRKGSVAVVEFSEGKMASYTGDDLPVPVLNNNSYAESLRHLGFHQGFGGEKIVSNGPESSERFVRAAMILRDYNSLGQRPIVDHAFAVLKSVEQEDTQWSIAYSIPRRLVFFKTKAHRRLKIINLTSFSFSCASPSLMLPVNTEAVGNLSRRFVPYDPQKNGLLLNSVFRRLQELGELDAPPQDEMIRKMASYPDACCCR